MKKKTRKKVIRRKRRSIREKRVMRIKRGLMKSAKKLHLGAKRTGAYVYGTLRRIVGNRGLTPRQQKMLDFLKRVYPQYSELARDSATKKDASRLARLKLIKVRSFKRTGTSRGKRFSMMIMEARAMAPKGGQLSSPVLGLARNSRRAFPTPRFVGKGEYVWKKLTPSQKLRFIMESPRGRQSTPRSQELFASRSWNFLPRSLKIDLEATFANVESDELMRNPMRSSFDKPTFGPMNTETRRVDTTTMAGMKEAERLQRAGWYQGPVTLFSTTYYRKRALPKSSIARQIRGNRRYKGDARRKREADAFYSKYMGPGGDLYQRATREELAEYQNAPFSDRARIQDRVYARVQRERMMRRNPPMYAHRMMSHRTHGLSLKQMMKLYRLVSSGNPKAVMFARRTLGIPMSESLSQVKAVVYHHVLDLKGKI